MEKRTEVIIHQDVLEEDMTTETQRGHNTSLYERILERLKGKNGLRVPYEVSPQELAAQFQAGDIVMMSGCYGSERECVEEYSQALIAKGVIVHFDSDAIMY